MEADLLLHSITDPVDQSALAALDLILGADRSRKCDQLDLAQHGYSRSVHIRQVHDSNGDGNLAGSSLDHDRVILANAQLEELGVPVVWIVECPDLPGLMEASVWIMSTYTPAPSLWAARFLPVPLTTPTVTLGSELARMKP